MAIDKIVAEYRLELDGLKQDVNQIKGQLKSTEEAAKSSADQVSGKLTNAFKSVGAAIASAFAIEQITSFARESVDLAAKAEGVKRAFDNLNRAGLLDELRTATKGTVSDLQLMTTAVKAANFKIPLDQLAKLLKFAQQRAVETGDSIDYLVESIVLGISRKSIPILDNLGLSASEVQNEFQKTGDMAIAVGNIIDRSMTGAGDATLTAAEKQAQLTASIENFKLQIGNSLLPVVEKLWSGLAKLVTGFSDVKDESIQTREESARLLVQNKKEYDQLQLMIDRYDNLSAKTVKTQEDKAELSRIVFQLQSEFGKSVTQINNETGALELNRTAIIKQMQSRAAMMSQDAQSILAQQAKLNYLKDEQIAIQKTLEEQMKAGQGNDIIAQKYMNASQMASHYQEQIDSLTKELQKLGVSTESLVIPSTDATGETLKDVNKIIQENIKSLQEYNAELVKLGLAPSVTLDQALKYFEEYDALNKTEQEKEIDAVNKKYEKLLADADLYGADRAVILRAQEAELKALKDKFAQEEKDKEDKLNEERLSRQKKAAEDRLQAEEEALRKQQEKVQSYFNAISGLASGFNELSNSLSESRIAQLESELDKGLISQEQYDDKLKEIQKEQAKRDKAFRVFQAIIGTAQSIINAATSTPFNPALIALAAATGIAQTAAIVSAPLPKFKDGVIDLKGKGTETSDSNLALLSKGESVITAKATRKHKDALEAIQKDRFDEYVMQIYAKQIKDKQKDTAIGWDEYFYRQYLLQNKLINATERQGDKVIEAVREIPKRHRFQ